VGRVVVVGSSNTDLTITCRTLPGRGETVLGSDLYTAAGGKGANQAVAAARAGAEVAFVGAVGSDDFGRARLADLENEGITTRHVRVKRGESSGVALIFVEQRTGENLIGVAPGANAALTPADVDRAAPAIRRADLLLLQLEVPIETVERAARIAHDAGTLVLLNPAPMPARRLPRSLLANVDYLVPNRIELERVTGGAEPDAAAKRLFLLDVKALIVTLGAEGARIVTPEGDSTVPAFPAKAVDTVGAGDCFCGYLAAGLAEGMAAADAALMASAAASISVTRRGAQPSIPKRSEAERLLTRAAGRKRIPRR